jgi:hypothetical protein
MKQFFTKTFMAAALLFVSVQFTMAQNKPVPSDADAAFPGAEQAIVAAPTPDNQALWDILYAYDLLAISGVNGNAGVMKFNNEFWVSRWAQDTLLLLDNMGNLVTKFSIPGLYVTGSNARSFTTDGTFIYAGVNTNSIKKIDPGTVSIVGTINAPAAARSLTYDPTAAGGAGGFWLSNFSTDIVQIDMMGNTLATISSATHGLGAMYGTVFDNYTMGGPYLWVFDQGAGTQSDLVQINTTTGLQTGIIHDVNGDVGALTGSTGIAGGVFLDPTGGQLVLMGVMQGTPSNILFGYDMDVTTGLSQIPEPKDFLNINPSVTSDLVNVNIDKDNNDAVLLQIVDAAGKVVFDKYTHAINNYINVSNYDNGLYFVRIVYNGQPYSSRFMKM